MYGICKLVIPTGVLSPHIYHAIEMICIWYGFPCEMDFSHPCRMRRRWDSETSGENTIQNAFFSILYTLTL